MGTHSNRIAQMVVLRHDDRIQQLYPCPFTSGLDNWCRSESGPEKRSSRGIGQRPTKVFRDPYVTSSAGLDNVRDCSRPFCSGTFNTFWVFVTPLLGGVLADTIFGRYNTIMIFSVVCLYVSRRSSASMLCVKSECVGFSASDTLFSSAVLHQHPSNIPTVLWQVSLWQSPSWVSALDVSRPTFRP